MGLSAQDRIQLEGLRSKMVTRRQQLSLLIRKHKGLIDSALKVHRLRREELEEVYQDTFLTFMQKVDRDEFRGESSISSFIAGIFRYKVADELKKKATIKRAPEEKASAELKEQMSVSTPDIMDRFHLEDIRRRAAFYLNLIDEKCKQVLVLAIYHQFDMEAISDRMGFKNAHVARDKKYVCLKQLKKIIKEQGKVLNEG